VKLSASWEATQGFYCFSLLSVLYFLLVYFRILLIYKLTNLGRICSEKLLKIFPSADGGPALRVG
jgi:hypothetical protein